MHAEDVVYKRLADDSTLAALVSRSVDNKPDIFPAKPAQDTPLAYLVYTRTGGRRVKSLDGVSSLRYAEVQVEAWATTWDACRDLIEAAEAALDEFRDNNTGGPCHGIDVIDGDDTIEEIDNEYHATRTFLVVADLAVN